MLKRLFIVLLTLGLAAGLAACGTSPGDDGQGMSPETDPPGGTAEAAGDGETWALYWYLCGSDLESFDGAATADLAELTAVAATDRVTVVIQTGGAEAWENPEIDPALSQRFVYSAEGLALVDEGPVRNMGDGDTLADFLTFCTENYPADRAALIFWNHGAGTVGGIAFDELFDYDSLSLDELGLALAAVFGESPAVPPLELVGFDACLMATIDTAAVFRDYARYMVASQELEPGGGWDYTGLMNALTARPDSTGEQLGRDICDGFAAACEREGEAEDITLSVVNLSRVGALVDAYHSAGVELLTGAYSDPGFFGQYSRGARAAESYGGNSREDGYTNMVDLGDLVRNSASLAPESGQAVLDALDACVVYRINGPYRARSGGLSCYYAFDGDRDSLSEYAGVAASESFVYLYEYAVSGSLPEAALGYLAGLGEGAPQAPDESIQLLPEEELPLQPPSSMLETVDSMELEDYPVTVTEDGYALLELGPDIAAQLSGVYIQLAYIDEEEDLMIHLGRDNDMTADWDAGWFEDNFRGVWGAMDGCLVYMDLIDVGDDYNLYTVPILLNGESYNLRVSYDFTLEEFAILGARRPIDGYGMSDRNLRHLLPGDEITTLLYAASLYGEDDLVLTESETFTVTKDTRFYEEELDDGSFLLMYEMTDIAGNSALSALVLITVDGGEIYLEEY